MIPRLRELLLHLADATTISGKVTGIIVALTLIFGIGFTAYVRLSTRLLLTTQLESRGVTIAEGLASRAVEPVLMGNDFALHGLLEETRTVNHDVRYLLVISARNELLGSTFRRQVPIGLMEANTLEGTGERQVKALRTDEGEIRDIAFPLFGGRGGVIRVGMSAAAVERELNDQTVRLLIATVVVSVLAIWATMRLSRVLARPVLLLMAATEQVARGELGVQAPVLAKDEIGRLAVAFNRMTIQIADQVAEIQRFSGQVLRDNAELTALSQVTRNLSRVRHLDTLPTIAAQLIQQSLELDEVYVYLWRPDLDAFHPSPQGRYHELAQVAVQGGEVCVVDDMAAVPLLAGENRLGVLLVRSQNSDIQSHRSRSFLLSLGNHLSVALQNAGLLSELTEKQHVLKHLFDQAVSAQEEERRRISRELHDETSQSLTSLMLGLRSVEDSSSPDELAENIRLLRGTLTETLDSVHQMARRLRPVALDDLGLAAALSRHVQEFCARAGLAVDLDLFGLGEQRLPPEVETAVYRIIQEALTNVSRHAGATEVSVVVERSSNAVIAMIEDNGRGFDVDTTLHTRRLGLAGMRERAGLLGGTVAVESVLGHGTTVCLRIPLATTHGGVEDAHSSTAGR